MPISFVQFVPAASGNAYVNISPTAGNALFLTNTISGAANQPSQFQAMSGTGGTGSVLGTFTIPTPLQPTLYSSPNIQVAGAYLLNVPAGVSSVLGTWPGGTPGTNFVTLVELSGVDHSVGYVTAIQNGLHAPGTTADSITTGTTSVSSSATYLLGICSDFNGHQTFVAGTGYTALQTASNFSLAEGRAISSAGSYAATFTDATNGGGDEFGITMFALAANATSQAMSAFTSGTSATRF